MFRRIIFSRLPDRTIPRRPDRRLSALERPGTQTPRPRAQSNRLMNANHPLPAGISNRALWLRRGGVSVPNPSGAWHGLTLSALGNAAARETFLTATPHMAALWTDLFQSIIVPGSELRWCENGPGIGRDARIAYSSLLGRYVARAYLTDHEGVQALVPLEMAKRQLQGTPYVIEKDPSSSRGLEADWIGFDGSGLVIVEAKGTFDEGVRTWRGPYSRPQILQTAIAQAARTAVFARSPRRKLPAKRWAIASRWGTVDNDRDPTLLAWDPEEEKLDRADYEALGRIFRRADVAGVLGGLGYPKEAQRTLDADETFSRSTRLYVDNRELDPGFAAMVGPFGVLPLRGNSYRLQERRDSAIGPFALASLSSQYAKTVIRNPLWPDDEAEGDDERSAHRRGLTVVWPDAGMEIRQII